MKSIRISVAILLTVALFIQTRYFGPNREYTVEGRCGELTVQHTAPRNHKGDGPATLEVVVDGPERDGAALPLKVQGRTEVTDDPQPGWDYYPVHEIKKNDDGGTCLGFEIPPLPIGTRFLYRFVTGSEEENLRIILAQKDDKPMTLKYEGEVPAWVLIPHIRGRPGLETSRTGRGPARLVGLGFHVHRRAALWHCNELVRFPGDLGSRAVWRRYH